MVTDQLGGILHPSRSGCAGPCVVASRNRILGTAPMPHGVGLFVIPFPIGMLILEELRKWLAARTLPGSVDRSPSLLSPPRLADPRSSKARKAP
jgi:hypothetical protein